MYKTPSRSARLLTAGLALISLAAAEGCRRPAGQNIVLTKDQEQQIAENILAAPPAVQNKQEIKFEDKITLLGYDIKGEVKKGGSFDLAMYWRVDEPVHGDWKVFVHFEAVGKRRLPLDHYGVGGLYPVANWKKGEIIRDVVNVQVPADWPDGPTQVLVGFFDWGALTKSNQDRRLKVEQGKGLPDDRVLMATLNIGGGDGKAADPKAGGAAAQARPPVAPPEYVVVRAAQAPVIDGKIDEASWQSARSTADFRQPDARPLSAELQTNARLLWDDENLYFTATTKDSDIKNDHKTNDDTLWEGDVIELFVQLPGQEGKYVELQWAPNGARFDAQFVGPRKPEWQTAKAFESGEKHAIGLDGTVGDATPDKAWTVEASIPWKGLGLSAAPASGTRVAANIYRIDDKGAHDLGHMGAWAPVGGDFHKLDGAGTLILQGNTPTAAAPGDHGQPLHPLAPVK